MGPAALYLFLTVTTVIRLAGAGRSERRPEALIKERVDLTNTSLEQISLQEAIPVQTELLVAGKPLEAFDRFADVAILMYANDAPFASGATEGRAKQEPYINAAVSIRGRIEDVKILADQEICVFRNLSAFTDTDGRAHQINGLCWQRWSNGRVVEERYYDGPQMEKLIDEGVLDNPALLTRTSLFR